MLFYRKRLDVSTLTRSWLALLIRDHRRRIGSRYRRLTEREQALLVLAHLREGETYLDLAASFAIGAATAHKILTAFEAAGLRVLADKGYIGAGGALIVPVKGNNLTTDRVAFNRSHAALRGPAERANAQLKTYKILTKLRSSPSKAT